MNEINANGRFFQKEFTNQNVLSKQKSEEDYSDQLKQNSHKNKNILEFGSFHPKNINHEEELSKNSMIRSENNSTEKGLPGEIDCHINKSQLNLLENPKEVFCPYEDIGCTTFTKNGNKSLHLKSQNNKHNYILIDWIINTKNEILAKLSHKKDKTLPKNCANIKKSFRSNSNESVNENYQVKRVKNFKNISECTLLSFRQSLKICKMICQI